MPVRYDIFSAKIAEKIDKNGTLIVKGRPTKAGVLTYLDDNGQKIRELRHPDDVFEPVSMNSLGLKPFTLVHQGRLINPENFKDYNHGTTGENIVRTDDDCLECTLSINSREAIKKIGVDGYVELSAGYTCDILKKSGHYLGQRYDQIQKNIQYNHVSLVPKGRAGSKCRIRLDNDSAVLANEFYEEKKEMPDKVIKEIPALKCGEFRLDAVTVEETSDTLKLVEQRQRLSTELLREQTRNDRLEGEKTQLESDKTALDEKLKDSIPKERFDAAVNEAVKLRGMAAEIKIEGAEKMGNEAIKKAICLKMNPGLKDMPRFDSDVIFADGVFAQIELDWKNKVSQKKQIDGINDFSDKQPKTEGDTPIEYGAQK